MLAYFAIAAFAGVRPDEIRRLAWSDIDFAENHIRIAAEHSKTRTRRFVELEANLVEWLLPFRRQTGLVAPETAFPRRFRAVRKEAGLAFEDLNKLRKNVAHRSPNMLFQHYHKAVKPADAARYWQIKPPAESSKGLCRAALFSGREAKIERPRRSHPARPCRGRGEQERLSGGDPANCRHMHA